MNCFSQHPHEPELVLTVSRQSFSTLATMDAFALRCLWSATAGFPSFALFIIAYICILIRVLSQIGLLDNFLNFLKLF